MKKRILAAILAAVLALCLLPTAAFAGEATLPTDYTTDSNGIMAYKYTNSTFDIYGYDKSWLQTTYGNGGFKSYIKAGDETAGTAFPTSAAGTDILGKGINVKTELFFENSGKLLKITYTVKNNGDVSKTVSVGACADIQIGDDDAALITEFADGSGFKMVNMISGEDEDSQFNFFGKNCLDANVDSFWYGKYGGDSEYPYYNNKGTYAFKNNERESGDFDSAMSFSWNNKTVAAGKEIKLYAYIGIGGKGSESAGLGLRSIQIPSEENPTGGIVGYNGAAQTYNYIYMGKSGEAPIKWRVLNNKTSAGETGLFLLSENLIGTTKFSGTDNVWSGGTAQSFCVNFYESSFSAKEQTAILPTSVTDAAYPSATPLFAGATDILNGDYVFFLSAEEAEKEAYGFTNTANKIAKVGEEAKKWWLRSPSKEVNGEVGCVGETGTTVCIDVKDTTVYARPALNINANVIAFTSAAVGGKASGPVGKNALTEVSSVIPTEWKLTLKEMMVARGFGFNAEINSGSSETVTAGKSVLIDYQGATTGERRYISAMIIDAGGKVLYYGNIASAEKAGASDGTAVEVVIPSSLPAGNYTLKIINEELNGDKNTDYSFGISDIDIIVKEFKTVTNNSPVKEIFPVTNTAGETNPETGANAPVSAVLASALLLAAAAAVSKKR